MRTDECLLILCFFVVRNINATLVRWACNNVQQSGQAYSPLHTVYALFAAAVWRGFYSSQASVCLSAYGFANYRSFVAVSVLCHVAVGWQAAPYTKLEESLLKSYDKKHRPVKDDSTTMQVQVYMVVTHVEQVNEQEQTMKMHGMVWVSWTDEYLTWTPADWNSTRKISIDSWKIWQPALALYNNAKGNGWNLYMYGLPATLSNDGKVWAMGTFSFLVTCLFDFSNYPYDEQECPVVIADWVYDLSRVNLSDPMGNNPWNKPSVRLNYDPMSTTQKKHVAASLIGFIGFRRG
uniref:Neurotransmitter-gated ion-channel ligand-binding domain-containing protein n=1 Tax=Plectus sambesii TaxID=2011161 RepID=A0A914UKE8_9BILA